MQSKGKRSFQVQLQILKRTYSGKIYKNKSIYKLTFYDDLNNNEKENFWCVYSLFGIKFYS